MYFDAVLGLHPGECIGFGRYASRLPPQCHWGSLLPREARSPTRGVYRGNAPFFHLPCRLSYWKNPRKMV